MFIAMESKPSALERPFKNWKHTMAAVEYFDLLPDLMWCASTLCPTSDPRRRLYAEVSIALHIVQSLDIGFTQLNRIKLHQTDKGSEWWRLEIDGENMSVPAHLNRRFCDFYYLDLSSDYMFAGAGGRRRPSRLLLKQIRDAVAEVARVNWRIDKLARLTAEHRRCYLW